MHHDPTVPIYFAWKNLGGPVSILTEGASGSYWVSAPDQLDDGRYRPLYADLADMLGYWIWQLDAGLIQLGIIVPKDRPLIVRLEIEPTDAWFSPNVEVDDVEPARCIVMGESELPMRFSPSTAQLLDTRDNAGERHIVKILLEGVSQLPTVQSVSGSTRLPAAMIDNLVEQYAPLGRKKKFFTISDRVDRRLDIRFLPPFRKVQAPDEEVLLDMVGEFVIGELGIEPGPISEDQWTSVLREVVSFLVRELERRVASLSSTGLLECLVAANEAVLHEQAKRLVMIPTQLACFGSAESMIEHLRRELPEASKAATASRVLIEYVTAQPSNGSQPISLATYDRLLATISDLQDWAFISDDIHFGLSGHDLDVLPSGRLGVGRENFVSARELFLSAWAVGEIGRSDEAFARHWKQADEESRPPDEELDAATTFEFGLPVSKLIEFLGALVEIGEAQDSAAKVVAKDELIEQLKTNLGWTIEGVQVAFDLFAAMPRAAFLEPPPPFSQKDAWPWNFNRALLPTPTLVGQGKKRSYRGHLGQPQHLHRRALSPRSLLKWTPQGADARNAAFHW